MNKSLIQIESIDDRLRRIRKVVASNEHNAAGVTIHLYTGVVQQDEEYRFIAVELGMSADVQGLMDKIVECLLESRAYWVKQARAELDELERFFTECVLGKCTMPNHCQGICAKAPRSGCKPDNPGCNSYSDPSCPIHRGV